MQQRSFAMPSIHPAAREHEVRRWMRPDAHRFVSPTWRRFVQPGSEAAALFSRYEAKYRPDQLRHPKGVPEGGRFADEGRGRGANSERSSRIRVAGSVIPICIVASKAVFGDGTWKVGYICADGQEFTRTGSGRIFGVIRQPK
jgi:hypothetical protein